MKTHAQTSFQEILAQFMEDETPSSVSSEPAKIPRESLDSVVFLADWTPSLGKNGRYPTTPRAPIARQPATEWVLKSAALKPADRAILEELLQFGAQELETGLNLKRLKHAWRRLAKQVHPDAGGTAERFRALQRAYTHLKRVLPEYPASALTRDSESASAAASQRPNAA